MSAPTTPSAAVRARGRRPAAPPSIFGLCLAIVLAIPYLIVAPSGADLAAASYRSYLFAHHGFLIWDNGWYAGHPLPSYSLLAPALGAWLGLRTLIALCAVVAAGLFGVLAAGSLPRRAANAATLVFAFGFCCELPSGRVPFDLSVPIGLACVLALQRRLAFVALPLAILTALASPVGGAFLAMCALALALARARGRRLRAGRTHAGHTLPGHTVAGHARAADIGAGRAGGGHLRAPLAACLASLATIGVLSLAFGEGGSEPFVASAFWPQLGATVVVAFALSTVGRTASTRLRLPETTVRTLTIGAALYALSLILAFVLRTPVGGNAARLGNLLGAPLVVAMLLARGSRSRPARAALMLAVLAPLLLYWQLSASVHDQVTLAGDHSVSPSYYKELAVQLRRLAAHGPLRVEIPPLESHFEAAELPRGEVSIARGWERQLDRRYGATFYRAQLTPRAYKRWLARNAVAYVALSTGRLDYAARAERKLIEQGLPYLRLTWRSQHWRLYQVRFATPLAQPPAKMLHIGADSFVLSVPKAGAYQVRLRFTPYWAIGEVSPAGTTAGSPAGTRSASASRESSRGTSRACVAAGKGGFTEVSASKAGRIEVHISFSLQRVLARGARCVGRD